MASSLIKGQVSDLTQFLTPNGQPNKVMIDRYWGDWIHDRIEKTNNFYKSGIIGATPQLDQKLLTSGQGYKVMVPHTTPINTNVPVQRLTNHTDIIANPSFGAYSAEDVKMLQAQSFGASTVDDYLTGADSFDNISSQFADYESELDEKTLIKVINEAFLNDRIANAKMLDKSGQDFSAKDFAKALARMGDTNMNGLTKLAVNSATYQYMRAQDLIKYVVPSGALHAISTYNGFQIVVDDDIPLDKNGNTVMYIFGNGAVTYTAVTMPNGVNVTTDDMAQGGIKAITHKRVVVAHVNGTMADENAAESAGYDQSTWDLAVYSGKVPLYQPLNDIALKNMNLVKYNFKIDQDFVVPGVNTNSDNVADTEATVYNGDPTKGVKGSNSSSSTGSSSSSSSSKGGSSSSSKSSK